LLTFCLGQWISQQTGKVAYVSEVIKVYDLHAEALRQYQALVCQAFLASYTTLSDKGQVSIIFILSIA
jgi:hypothetical protein